jgi:hypothetical protein
MKVVRELLEKSFERKYVDTYWVDGACENSSLAGDHQEHVRVLGSPRCQW